MRCLWAAQRLRHLGLSALLRRAGRQSSWVRHEALRSHAHRERKSIRPEVGGRATEGACGMTKFELVRGLSEAMGITHKDTEEIITAAFNEIAKAVHQGARFHWPGFGVWTVRTRKARRIRNPSTGEMMRLKKTV